MADNETRIGVDVGGTFTDVVTIQNSDISLEKYPSTRNPDEGVIEKLGMLIESSDLESQSVDSIVHGTTVATNALLEGELAKAALVNNEGFRDVLEIGRQTRPDIYDLNIRKHSPVIERDRRYTIPGRINERGQVETPLDDSKLDDVVQEINSNDIDSVAVSLLFAYENNEHEKRVAEAITEENDSISISISSEVLPEIREFERTLVTSINAGLRPVIDSYLESFEVGLNRLGFRTPLQIMQSNGGIINSSQARQTPVNTILSGPAAGVQGAAYVGNQSGFESILTMDMGGTSCDVSLVTGGEPVVSTDVTVGEYPIQVPMIDVHTIGAGGGSIGWLDVGGALRVGPEGAGADPGPVCYGQGGVNPTVTDAHVIHGRISMDSMISEELAGDINDVRDAFEEHLAKPSGMSVEEAANGVLDVANSNMERALRVVSVEKGHDPREFTLVAFGGAGPLHATKIAEELGISSVLIPRFAGGLSALGLLITDALHDFSVSRVRPWGQIETANLETTFSSFEERAMEKLKKSGYSQIEIEFQRAVDIRYVGQSFDITVPVDARTIDVETLGKIEDRFHKLHERRYGHSSRSEPIELVTVRLRARGLVEPPEVAPITSEGTTEKAIREQREVGFGDTSVETNVYDREYLPASSDINGPAIIESQETTIVIRPDQIATVDEHGSILVEVYP